MKEAKNDPIKKADLIRDMVVSISKIRSYSTRNLYSGMFQNYGYLWTSFTKYISTTNSKDTVEVAKMKKELEKAFEVIKNVNPVDVQK
jgi:DNA primase